LQPQTLDTETLALGVAFLSEADADLARIHTGLGLPPLWARQPGFPTLVHIILEQQVSLASARAAFRKLEDVLGIITPDPFLTLTDEELKRIGFSRQKTTYCRYLAQAILKNELNVDALEHMDDPAVRTELTRIKGIGPWTADIYLLMALLRPDIWPAGDLALATAMQEVKNLPARPGLDEMERIAASWRPWRAVAARLLWHHYLSK
jgi:DNA-3-methyladenine glycosylase II